MADKQTAVAKRQQIKDSNKMMFIWIAGASVIVGFAMVTAWFLWQQAAFKMTVVGEKNATAKTLEENNSAAVKLGEDIRVLRTNPALESVKENPDDNAVQVILDALPADSNELALGSSLQKKLLDEIPGLEVESISIEPTATEELSEEAEGGQINFSITVKSKSADSLNKLLGRIERSIRVIDIDNLELERSSAEYTLRITAHAYYEPAQEVKLGEKKI